MEVKSMYVVLHDIWVPDGHCWTHSGGIHCPEMTTLHGAEMALSMLVHINHEYYSHLLLPKN